MPWILYFLSSPVSCLSLVIVREKWTPPKNPAALTHGWIWRGKQTAGVLIWSPVTVKMKESSWATEEPICLGDCVVSLCRWAEAKLHPSSRRLFLTDRCMTHLLFMGCALMFLAQALSKDTWNKITFFKRHSDLQLIFWFQSLNSYVTVYEFLLFN